MLEITLRGVPDLGALEAPWRALEQRSAASFFQGWTWTGCLAAERFTDPVLLEARAEGRTVALALFNCHPARLAPATLLLGESGDPRRDAVFVEHNGPLLETADGALLKACLGAALAAPLPGGGGRRGRAVILSGVGDAVLAAARALPAACLVRRSRPAPFVDLARLGAAEFPAALSPSTRYQLRRSHRRYAHDDALTVRRAADVPEALRFLDSLAVLHQATWTGRGRPGAFADSWFVRFHRELVARGLPRGEIDLLRIAAGERVIGYLYNLLQRDWVGNYQGGFDYASADSHQKPGLTCHHMAVEFYRAEQRSSYDLLAGDDRYKASLAQSRTELHWLELVPRWSLRHLAATGRKNMQSIVSATRHGIARHYRLNTSF